MDAALLTSRYREHVLETGHPPASVFAFASSIGISEREFFEHYASFEALEGAIWRGLIEETVAAVEGAEDGDGFTAQQKLLTFHFALCDRILDERSFFLVRFPRPSSRQKPVPRLLCGMREAFLPFAKRIIEAGMERDEVVCRGPLNRGYPQALFLHLLSVIEFNLSDNSSGFERTDAFIEKSVRLAFDLIGTQAVDSAFDLARFLFHPRV